MSVSKLVMSVVLLFSVTTVLAQDAPVSKKRTVTKGYYAIGNNAQKLSPSKPLATKPVTLSGVEYTKGYYSIANNRAKLSTEAGYVPLYNKRTVVKKGYYGIGNNGEKLKN